MAILIEWKVKAAPLDEKTALAQLSCGVRERELEALHNLCGHHPDWRRSLKLCEERLAAQDERTRELACDSMGALTCSHGADAVQAALGVLRRLPEDFEPGLHRRALIKGCEDFLASPSARDRRQRRRPLPRAEVEAELASDDPKRVQDGLDRL